MRKKILGLILCLCLSGVAVGCGDAGSDKESVAANASVSQTEEPVQATPEPTPEPTTEPTPEPTPEPVLPYVEENNLAFSQETSITLQGSRYNSDNPSDWEFTDVEWEITGITIENAEEEGYRNIIVEVTATGYIVDTPDHHVRRLFLVTPVTSVCDMYTGRVLPAIFLDDSLTNAEVTDRELEWGGSTYTISYAADKKVKQGDWKPADDGLFYSPLAVTTTYAIKTTEGYDGLVLRISSITSYSEMFHKIGVSDDKEEYIMDGWDDSSHLYRISELYDMFH